ncbi:ABC transporter substrate-binding protein [Arcobacter sp. LA11]|uniref:ABC transporter substrate-binding protein n=1 Tax=Arcobacter sp. LA11 TaxID=1898176 RepID=UPI00093481A4|nr:ABC transporter substrate-binding protein [Arcobacter sp. LA11]
MMNKKVITILLVFILILVSIFAYIQFNKKEKVTIGFVGALTGKYSVLGNAMINGVLLAFEEKNYQVGNKSIEIVFQDDKQDKRLNKEIINNYIKEDIKIVIGNVTSSMSKVSMSIINKHKDMFMISAASASNEFSKKDDQFFRVHVANNNQRFDSFTNFVLENGFKKVYGIYDPFNATYSKDYLVNFEKSFIQNGGEKFLTYAKTNDNLDKLISDIKEKKPDIIVMCANSVDAARVLQYVRLKGLQTQFAMAEWARTPSFLENSGKSSEGVIFNIDYDEESKNPNYLKFVKNYKKKYKTFPSMYAAKAYELSSIIIESLENVSEDKIKEYVLNKKEFTGLQDTIIFDKYGDVIREFYSFKVINGKYVRIK